MSRESGIETLVEFALYGKGVLTTAQVRRAVTSAVEHIEREAVRRALVGACSAANPTRH